MSQTRTKTKKQELVTIDRSDSQERPEGGGLIKAPSVLSVAPRSKAAELFLRQAEGECEQPSKVAIIAIDHDSGQFKMPSGELVDEVQGYVVHSFRTRKWYEKPYKPGQRGVAPDCWSADMLAPHPSSANRQSSTCATCKHNKFGTAQGGAGKSCREQTWLFLCNPVFGAGGLPPIAVLIAPPSSFHALDGGAMKPGFFAQAIALSGGAYQLVWAKFSLDRQPGAKHSTLAPSLGPVCTDPDEVTALVKIRNCFLDLMQRMSGMTPTVDSEGEHKEGGDQ